MTAEVADGWLPIFFVPEKAKDVFGPSLDAGTATRDSSLDTLQIAAGGILAIGEESKVAPIRDLGRGAAALYIGGMGAKGKNFYNAVARRYGYEKEQPRFRTSTSQARRRRRRRWCRPSSSRRRHSAARSPTSRSASPPWRKWE